MSFNEQIAHLIIEEFSKESLFLNIFQLPEHNQRDVYDTAEKLISTGQIDAKIKFFGDNRTSIEFQLKQPNND